MNDIIKSALYGIVEGITEWLPISSTGHMILLNELVKMDVSESFFSLFLVVIQLGAILAVVIMFWDRLWPFAKRSKNKDPLRRYGLFAVCVKSRFRMWGRILIACIPAAVVGVLFDDVLDRFFYNPLCVSLALIVFGIIFLVIESIHISVRDDYDSVDTITIRQALIIGIWQLVAAVFPGTSRSGATIIGAILLGLPRSVAAEFTFLLAVPVMLGASLLKVLKFGFSFSGHEIAVLVCGMIVAFSVSIFVIRFLMDFIRKHSFKIFGYYRIVLGLLVFGYFTFFR